FPQSRRAASSGIADNECRGHASWHVRCETDITSLRNMRKLFKSGRNDNIRKSGRIDIRRWIRPSAVRRSQRSHRDEIALVLAARLDVRARWMVWIRHENILPPVGVWITGICQRIQTDIIRMVGVWRTIGVYRSMIDFVGVSQIIRLPQNPCSAKSL